MKGKELAKQAVTWLQQFNHPVSLHVSRSSPFMTFVDRMSHSVDTYCTTFVLGMAVWCIVTFCMMLWTPKGAFPNNCSVFFNSYGGHKSVFFENNFQNFKEFPIKYRPLLRPPFWLQLFEKTYYSFVNVSWQSGERVRVTWSCEESLSPPRDRVTGRVDVQSIPADYPPSPHPTHAQQSYTVRRYVTWLTYLPPCPTHITTAAAIRHRSLL